MRCAAAWELPADSAGRSQAAAALQGPIRVYTGYRTIRPEPPSDRYRLGDSTKYFMEIFLYSAVEKRTSYSVRARSAATCVTMVRT